MFKKSCSTVKFHSKRLLSLQKVDVVGWKNKEQVIMEPFNYISKAPVTYYYKMPSAFNHWLQVPKEKLDKIEEVIHITSVWAVIIDDLSDESTFRYGVPTTHHVFDMNLTIHSASIALLMAGNKTMELGHSSALKVFMGLLNDHLVSQGTHVYWRKNNIWPSEEEYIDMSRIKNGSYYVLVVELMKLFSGNNADPGYSRLAEDLALHYSMLDDYYNLFDPKGMKVLAGFKEGSGEFKVSSDITEGKPTVPVLHAMQFPDVAGELSDILKQRTSDPKLLNRFVSLLKKHGSDQYLKDTVKNMEIDIREKIDKFGGNPQMTAYMDDLSVLKQ